MAACLGQICGGQRRIDERNVTDVKLRRPIVLHDHRSAGHLKQDVIVVDCVGTDVAMRALESSGIETHVHGLETADISRARPAREGLRIDSAGTVTAANRTDRIPPRIVIQTWRAEKVGTHVARMHGHPPGTAKV
nr:hypothetical protein [Bradyrhizobium liaoningense]